ncbi:RnfH family protein [Candidatus Thioglobus sp. NP1]|uniref:RnfH family protein n=1 Tax=Candidatus Thioglobus sp. NP1 TaxID=2508687 RepID=UPI000DED4894|nr:RnfH family protein [Candidatus Thioglobus sp. NP1]AXE61567.1 RnfH family protein [Candidatus Thioglobus sp. NP1]
MIVEVAYALADKQSLLTIEVKRGSTLKDAIEASGILESFKQIDLTKDRVGIFSKFASLDTILQEKDRVEIYRSLVADPKEVRKERAAMVKAMQSDKIPNSR